MTSLLRWLPQSTPHDRVACLIEPINLPSLELAESWGSNRSRMSPTGKGRCPTR